ncbi:transition state regulator Abh, partial [Bacillus anthracis]|nr:transition state regulator Abh [Bacillus anthracis]
GNINVSIDGAKYLIKEIEKFLNKSEV